MIFYNETHSSIEKWSLSSPSWIWEDPVIALTKRIRQMQGASSRYSSAQHLLLFLLETSLHVISVMTPRLPCWEKTKPHGEKERNKALDMWVRRHLGYPAHWSFRWLQTQLPSDCNYREIPSENHQVNNLEDNERSLIHDIVIFKILINFINIEIVILSHWILKRFLGQQYITRLLSFTFIFKMWQYEHWKYVGWAYCAGSLLLKDTDWTLSLGT